MFLAWERSKHSEKCLNSSKYTCIKLAKKKFRTWLICKFSPVEIHLFQVYLVNLSCCNRNPGVFIYFKIEQIGS